MGRRTLSPLQRWRAEYNYLSRTIRTARNAQRGGHVWGDYKRPALQSLTARLSKLARLAMSERTEAARLSRELAESNHQRNLQLVNGVGPDERLSAARRLCLTNAKSVL